MPTRAALSSSRRLPSERARSVPVDSSDRNQGRRGLGAWGGSYVGSFVFLLAFDGASCFACGKAALHVCVVASCFGGGSRELRLVSNMCWRIAFIEG